MGVSVVVAECWGLSCVCKWGGDSGRAIAGSFLFKFKFLAAARISSSTPHLSMRTLKLHHPHKACYFVGEQRTWPALLG